jgi:hypothetical protein
MEATIPNLNIPFNGQTLILPGAYYADNVSQTLPAPPTTPPLIFIGYGYGQAPFVPVTYDTPQNLLSGIRGGPASGYVPFLTSPSPQLNGAQQITFINCGVNTQSQYRLLSGTSGVINLLSTNYGLPSNLLQISVAAGILAGKTVTLYDGYANQTEVGNNLGVPFQLQYLGAATGVVYNVTVSGGVATTFATLSPNAGESVNIPLNPANYGTIQQVAEYLNGTGFYNASVIGNGALPSTYLDSATNVALASGAPAPFVNVTATLGDILYWVNNNSGSLATATLVSGVTSSTALAPTNIPLTPFVSGTSVPPTLSGYASGFNVALGIPGWSVFADSNSSGVMALGTQHAITASETVNGKWRRFFTGSTVGDSVATTVANAQAQDSKYTTYAYPGIWAVSTTTGLNTLYGGLYVAAAAAGMATGNAVATPLTNKALTGTGVEVNLTISQIDQLQQSGVMPIYIPQQTGVPTIVSDLTTWQTDANPENVFNQQIACRAYLAYSIVNATNPYVGTIADPITESKILTAVKTTLNALLYNSGNANGVLVNWDPTTLQLVYNGTQQLAAVSVSVMFVGQNRFITAYVTVLPTQFTISASS